MSLVYSSLCETSETAYIAYCIAHYGASVGRDIPVAGLDRDAGCDGGGSDNVVDVVMDLGCRDGAWTPWLAAMGRLGRGVGGGSSFECRVGDGNGSCERVERSTGVSGGDHGGECSVGDSHETGGSDVGDADGVKVAQVALSSGQGVGSGVVRGKHYKTNQRKRLAKARKANQEASVSGNEYDEREQNVRAKFHKGAFADCSQDVQTQLRESRAAMLIEKNKMEQVRAVAEKKRFDALIKSRMIERQVEDKRLKMDDDWRKRPQSTTGFAETIFTEGCQEIFTPSLSNGSISPDSSISVAELDRVMGRMAMMESEIKRLGGRLEEEMKISGTWKSPEQRADEVRAMEGEDYGF